MKNLEQPINQPITEDWQIEITSRLARYGLAQTEIIKTGMTRDKAVGFIDAQQFIWEDETRCNENYAAAWDNEDILVERTWDTQLVIHDNYKMVIINAINLAEQPWKKGTPTHHELAEHYSTRLF